MTPEQREELKQAAMKMAEADGSDESISAKEYTGISEVFENLSTPAAILSLIAQVEALTVPQDDLRDAAQTLIDVLDGYSETLVPVNRNSVTVKRLRAMLTIPAIAGTKEGA